jgi:hypothetical protein
MSRHPLGKMNDQNQAKRKPDRAYSRTRGKRGPTAEWVKIEADWEAAMGKKLKGPPQRKAK